MDLVHLRKTANCFFRISTFFIDWLLASKFGTAPIVIHWKVEHL
ncbi:hypothetical protein T01_9519 [Trichinella spiralis]|uniref:Uncharacterized protein n=1 Tax=Trichinella spiralis TaxID=6334 RepID=A0A0V1AN57_TRISP|nr:hypothetical protein T01_9519 [Trichinella spiralis]